MSAISRAFTTRRVKQSVDVAAANSRSRDMLQRSKTTKATVSVRNQISAPVELIHTTNMLSYNAPDISRANSSAHSVKSSDDEPDSPQTAASSPPTSPDIGPSDDVKASPAPNHLSCYFVAPSPAPAPASAHAKAVPADAAAPAIPKRSPSHTKQASYDAIARQRSLSVMSKQSDRTVSTKNSMTFSSRASSASTTASSVAHDSLAPSPKPPVPAVPPVAYQHYQPPPPAAARSESHPFGRELAQVSEIAEDYGIKHSVIDAEEQALRAQGLLKHSPESYAAAIQDLLADLLSEAPSRPRRQEAAVADARPDASSWI